MVVDGKKARPELCNPRADEGAPAVFGFVCKTCLFSSSKDTAGEGVRVVDEMKTKAKGEFNAVEC